MRTPAAIAVVCLTLVLGIVAGLQVPPYDALGTAIADLGPVAGWRCAESGSYAYDPRRGAPDTTLVADPPEAVVRSTVAQGEVQRVEVDLRSGNAAVWSEDAAGAQHVLELAPGRLKGVSLNRGGALVQICDSHLGEWQIVGDQYLG
ncbi:MAG: hypothetical protein JOZ81_22425 [Chloroflexi bacterium]|nr:hypothetical protein [Chloroflexota bacterium]